MLASNWGSGADVLRGSSTFLDRECVSTTETKSTKKKAAESVVFPGDTGIKKLRVPSSSRSTCGSGN